MPVYSATRVAAGREGPQNLHNPSTSERATTRNPQTADRGKDGNLMVVARVDAPERKPIYKADRGLAAARRGKSASALPRLMAMR
jgi:hypothetical protein